MRAFLKLAGATAMALAAAAVPAETPRVWDNLVAVTPAGNPVLGNQAAPVRLVEFISYTCPHCAHYHSDSAASLRSTLVRQGKVAVEVRAFIRNEVDVTASLLALCGSDQRFFANHDALLAAQSQWFKKPGNPDYESRWANPDFGLRMKAMAEDLGLYRIMLAQGYQGAELDRCLADQELAAVLHDDTDQAMSESGVDGTPSFLINGKLQTVHGWDELAVLLEAAARQPDSAVEKPRT
jgi:protein-disulfide isomerase